MEKLAFGQLQELLDRERRCDSNIKEMERLLQIMRREKDDLLEERFRLEEFVEDEKVRKEREEAGKNFFGVAFEYGSRWNELLYSSACISNPSKKMMSEDDCRKDHEMKILTTKAL